MAVAEPLARPRPRTRTRAKRRSARGGILWIAVGGILLAGVVFVNVAVLQLNLRLDSANAERSKLLGENAALQTQYAQLVSPSRVSAAATKQLGLVYQDPTQYGYVNLAGK
jgi:cell division protein FtsL